MVIGGRNNMRSGITRRWLRGSLLITVLLVLLVEVMFLYSATPFSVPPSTSCWPALSMNRLLSGVPASEPKQLQLGCWTKPSAQKSGSEFTGGGRQCWGLVLKCYELRTRQYKMLNVNALRLLKHYLPKDLINFGRRSQAIYHEGYTFVIRHKTMRNEI